MLLCRQGSPDCSVLVESRVGTVSIKNIDTEYRQEEANTEYRQEVTRSWQKYRN